MNLDFHTHEVPGDCAVVSMTIPAGFFEDRRVRVLKATIPWGKYDEQSAWDAMNDLRQIVIAAITNARCMSHPRHYLAADDD